ncbi:unnamed protein product [Ilex paraguariensis]|uniref:Uncharacterized protein n=1 Tax=Ilex paraguariensis TaxID=185542 RepID=A0ABC8S890_9AQUA
MKEIQEHDQILISLAKVLELTTKSKEAEVNEDLSLKVSKLSNILERKGMEVDALLKFVKDVAFKKYLESKYFKKETLKYYMDGFEKFRTCTKMDYPGLDF